METGQKLVPTIVERQIVTKETHISAGHAGINRTYELLDAQYSWYNMYLDCIKHIKNCKICNATNP